MTGLALRVLLLAGLTLAADGKADGQCPNAVEGRVLLQKHKTKSKTMEGASEEGSRSAAKGAGAARAGTPGELSRFLMQATFGPTRESMQELNQTTYEGWIRYQMGLPAEPLREYYRRRVNPPTAELQSSRMPCEKGSRWANYVFRLSDVRPMRKSVEVRGFKIFVDGAFRSDIARGPFGSSWTGLGVSNYTGFLCYIAEGVGQDVHIADDFNCRRNKKIMDNPAVWMDADVMSMDHAPTVVMKPGVRVLDAKMTSCPFDEMLLTGQVVTMKYYGAFYSFEPRVELVENTPGAPTADTGSCVTRSLFSEKSCRMPELVESETVVPGLRVEVVDWSTNPAVYADWLSNYRPYTPIAEFIVPKVQHSVPSERRRRRGPGGVTFSGFPLSDQFAARWTANITIGVAGEYTFFTTSDDGSRLFIDGQQIVDNGGWHGMRERSGTIQLSVGSHPIVVEFYQGGGGKGMEMRWQGPDSGNVKEIVPEGVFTTKEPRWSGCFISCGSPGEIANDPAKGHHESMRIANMDWDNNFDNRYMHHKWAQLSKGSVWTNTALNAKDQLRQRMAWSLSQIFVTSATDFGSSSTELWLNFYDIFVRNAFGNFRDILREIVYSPVMGRYLTHTGSTSYAYNNRFPNENLAREIMQLFTIGIDMLNPDGTVKVNAQGKAIPTYDNSDIMNFARVLTGFENPRPRANMELYDGWGNLIDPLWIDVMKHDFLPKPDLMGGYLGDGVRFCAGSLASDAFLAKGARYQFAAFASPGDGMVARELATDSQLYAAICAAGVGGKCAFAPVVELPAALACSGAECNMTAEEVDLVKVGGAYYEFVHPPCVHHYYTGSVANESASILGAAAPAGQGWCRGPESANGWTWFWRTSNPPSGTNEEKEAFCLAQCMAMKGYGCQLDLHRNRCYAIMAPMGTDLSHTHESRYWCWNFQDNGKLGYSYMMLSYGKRDCPEGAVVNSVEECKQALVSMGYSLDSFHIGWDNAQPDCTYDGSRGRFNMRPDGRDHSWIAPVCRMHLQVDEDANVVQADGQTKIAVPWLGAGHPAAGLHLAVAERTVAFSDVPTPADLLAKALDVAPPPAGSCSPCSPVGVYKQGEAIDEDTVFAHGGRFFQNRESRVKFLGSQHAFRNPPVYVKDVNKLTHPLEAVTAEVEALLDHLFHHPNTAVFIGRRLIMRLVSSNPSGPYLQAVQEAFRTGAYGGTTYSGQYGDLGATLAAVLLHPEARNLETGTSVSYRGTLREPYLKIIHLMRSMEYKDSEGAEVVFQELHEVIGQFPFQSPTVFNYYLADFELPAMPKAEPEPEPEAEPEPEPEAEPEPEPEAEPEPEPESEMEPEPEPEPSPMVSPEFQIFTPPYFMGYLNGVSNLIRAGVSNECAPGKSLGITAPTIEDGRWTHTCPQGSLTYGGADSMNATLEEMDVLLTGGRLTPVAKQVVQSAYEHAPEGQKLQSAQQAITMTAEFNTMGAPLPKPQPRTVDADAGASGTTRPYKAAVMLFLHGGADTWNMLVPQDCNVYQEYVDIRTDLAMRPNELLKFSTTGQVCQNFGMHVQLGFFKSLYDDGDAAWISNVGNLPEPTTKQEYRERSKMRCHGLFSHSDQQNAAQTLKCQEMGTGSKGAGGRIADALAMGPQKFHTTSFSLAGSNVWPQGRITRREIVSDNANLGFHDYERWRPTMVNITAQVHGNAYAEAYSKAFRDNMETTQKLIRAAESAQLMTNYNTANRFRRELQQVSKLIRAREGRGAERDFFFVSIGGWDMHQNMKNSLNGKMDYIDNALIGFVAEMKAQNVWDSVLLVTESEFARTLDSNGGGSDHAWAGNHFIIGGDLNGGKIFNKFPRTLAKGNDHDLGRGRLIPDYPFESVMVPIAQWMGVEANQLNDVFPNLPKFNSTHIIPRASLFKN